MWRSSCEDESWRNKNTFTDSHSTCFTSNGLWRAEQVYRKCVVEWAWPVTNSSSLHPVTFSIHEIIILCVRFQRTVTNVKSFSTWRLQMTCLVQQSKTQRFSWLREETETVWSYLKDQSADFYCDRERKVQQWVWDWIWSECFDYLVETECVFPHVNTQPTGCRDLTVRTGGCWDFTCMVDDARSFCEDGTRQL